MRASPSTRGRPPFAPNAAGSNAPCRCRHRRWTGRRRDLRGGRSRLRARRLARRAHEHCGAVAARRRAGQTPPRAPGHADLRERNARAVGLPRTRRPPAQRGAATARGDRARHARHARLPRARRRPLHRPAVRLPAAPAHARGRALVPALHRRLAPERGRSARTPRRAHDDRWSGPAAACRDAGDPALDDG